MNRFLCVAALAILLLGCSEPPATSPESSTLAAADDVTTEPAAVVEAATEKAVVVAAEVKPTPRSAAVLALPAQVSSKQVLQQVVEQKERAVQVVSEPAAPVQVAMVAPVAVIEVIPKRVTVVEDVTTQRILSAAEARDVAQLPETDRYVKVGQKGDWQLPQESRWSCILDRETGLLWETKSQGKLRNAEYEYVQLGEGGRCDGEDCRVEAYLERVNQAKLCGRDDWRVPKRLELLQLVDHAYLDSIPSIDIRYFSNTRKGRYWSSDHFEYSEKHAWAVSFEDGFDRIHAIDKTAHLRLVSGQ
ncbi:MAG: DUF1566 domain-containing protein [Gammaproteobacteria bacterium]|nr:DUF1566 domain-containing protein [Gammaproteobacteria bacterium]MCF6229587.1 DUF1566 domain-containing protein [Gammaproteobacteria bacterium]